MILPSRTPLYLAAALGLSLIGNVFLGWQWAQAKPECVAKTAKAALKATQAAETAEDARDKVSGTIARTADAAAATVVAEADTAVHADQEAIHNAYFNLDSVIVPPPVGPCVHVSPVPDRVQDTIDQARDRANAAKGGMSAAGNGRRSSRAREK